MGQTLAALLLQPNALVATFPAASSTQGSFGRPAQHANQQQVLS